MSTQRITKEMTQRWKRPGTCGFYAWLEDVQPRILMADSKYHAIELEDWQRHICNGILAPDAEDPRRYQHNMSLTVTPRRHSKTTLHALVVLWLFATRPNMHIGVIGNTLDHGLRVQFKTLLRIIRNTPLLKKLIPEKNIRADEIMLRQSSIKVLPVSLSAVFGDKFNLIWVGDLHAAADLEPFEALQSSLLDSQDTLCLIDANPDHVGGHVHKLEQLAEEDPRIFAYRIEYRDFEDYCERAPRWIDRDKARRQQATTLPAAFDRDVLGKRSDALNALFTLDQIEACKSDYSTPVEPPLLDPLFHSRKYLVGGGLDRAYGFSLNGDATVWTSVAKVAGDDDEAEFYVLNQKSIPFSSGKIIKKAISKDHERYGLENIAIEKFNAQDVGAWCADANLAFELADPSIPRQISIFTELYRIVSEGRLHFPRKFDKLADEMRTFLYDASKEKPKFGHAKGFHDDRVYSLAWAIWSLREQEMVPYELPRIVCRSKSHFAKLCYMRSGSMVIPCIDECEAHKRVEMMYLQYKRHKVESTLNLVEFYQAKVARKGARIYANV